MFAVHNFRVYLNFSFSRIEKSYFNFIVSSRRDDNYDLKSFFVHLFYDSNLTYLKRREERCYFIDVQKDSHQFDYLV